MRSILLAAALTSAAFMFPGPDAAAQNEPWCSQGREDGGESCRFVTYEQCVATSPDGWCIRNRAIAAPAPPAMAPAPATAAAPVDAPAPVQVRPARRPDTKQRAPNQGVKAARTAPPAVPTRATASISIPLPDRALLAPPPTFNCEFASADGANAPQQPTLASTQASPAGDAALRQKLDYERQCYRHAAIISRDRLQHLQTSVGETIKAVGRSEQAGGNSGIPAGSGLRIPLPAQALLTAPPDFDCEFKTADGGDARGPSPSPATTQTSASPDTGLRTKLDYELQCYRHVELIWRTRVQQLQASVGETIKAVNRSKTAAERRGNRK